jgi:hypothetical protein
MGREGSVLKIIILAVGRRYPCFEKTAYDTLSHFAFIRVHSWFNFPSLDETIPKGWCLMSWVGLC